MKKRILTFIIVLASVFMLASCEQKDQSEALTGQTVTLRLSGVEIPGARTIRPDTVKSAESYTVSLTEVSMNESGSYVPVQNSQNNKNNINATVSTDGSALTLTITNVHIGSYLVTVNGYTDNVRVLSGKSEASAPLVVSPSGGNSVTVSLTQVYENGESENLQGTVSVPLDWSSVTSERIKNGFQLIVFDDSDDTKIASYTYKPEEGEKTSDTFTFPTDVTPSRFVRFDLFNSDGTEFISTLRRTYIWVAAGNESKPMDGEKGIVINDMNLQPAFNIYNLKAEEKSPTSATLTWNNFGNRQLEKVNFWYTTEDSKPEEVTFTVNSGLDGNDASCELTKLEAGKEYKLWYQAVYKNGMVSSIDQYQGTIKTMVYVTGIDITNEESIETAVNGNFNLSVKIYPDNATDKTYTWDYDEKYFSVSGDQFTALKAGVKTITVKANGAAGGNEITDSIEIKTHLQTPVLNAKATAQGIELSGYQVDDAQSYDIYRNGEILVRSTQDSSYLDKDVKTSGSYSYHVIAKLTKNEVNLDSAQSNTTDSISIKNSVIKITIPEIEEGFDIVLSSNEPLFLEQGVKDSLTFSYEPEIESGYKIKWKVDGKVIDANEGSNGSRVTISLDKYSFYKPVNELTLIITDGNKSYSNSINFAVILPGAAVTGVSISTDNNLIITSPENESSREIQLDYSVSGTGNYSSLPHFVITEDSDDIATIDTNGKITFKQSVNGKITVRACGVPNTEVYDELTFYAFDSDIALATALVNEINSKWGQAFAIANDSDHFDGDWYVQSWGTKNYTIQATAIGGNSGSFYFKAADGLTTDSNPGYVKLSEVNFDSGDIFSNVTVSSENIQIGYIDKGAGGIGGKDSLSTVGTNSSDYITVKLNNREGKVKIYYDNINVQENSGEYRIEVLSTFAINQSSNYGFQNSASIKKLLP